MEIESTEYRQTSQIEIEYTESSIRMIFHHTNHFIIL